MVSVAILGYGTVGSGVAEVMQKNADKIAQNAAQEIKVKYILDLRDFSDSPHKDLFVKDFSVIENDPEVRIVIETIGGVNAAYDFTKRALLAGKNVVSSNKELVATHGHELIEIARERNLNYLFEASVGGGIPIIRPICQCLAANEIDEIYGILNGTTNYILTQMIQNGLAFEEALVKAIENGYAEKDPTADIDGHDACRKICILASLSFGRHIYPVQVPTRGIRGVTLSDVNYARNIDCKIKLIARAVRTQGNKIAAYVAPHLICRSSLLSNVEDVFNGIVVRGNAIGDVMFYGQGAGKLPTASAVVADVIDAVKHLYARKYLDWAEGGPDAVSDQRELLSHWYIRTAADESRIKDIFADASIICIGGASKKGEAAFATPVLSENELLSRIKELEVLSAFRILE